MVQNYRAVPRFDKWQAASRGHGSFWPPVASSVVHATAVLLIGWSVGAGARAISPDSTAYFVPPPLRPPIASSAAHSGEAVLRISLPGLGTGQAVPLSQATSILHVRARPTGDEQGTGQRADSVAPEQAYESFEVDNAAVFSSSSAVPAYPPTLQAAGIQGAVTVRFVVDTNGAADTETFEVVAMSRREFADAVRSALPRMRFAPARLNHAPVRQVVEQTFRFEMPHTRPDSSAI